MSGAQRIQEKILREAEEKAHTLLMEARTEAAAILEDAKKRNREVELEADRQIESGKTAQLRRNEATLHTEERKQSLAMRQRMVEEAFEKAAAALLALPVDRYAGLMETMLLESTWQGDAELVMSVRDMSRLGERWLAELDRKRAETGFTGKTTFSQDRLPTEGGFVVRVGELEINGTFPVILAGVRPKLEQEVVKILFA